MFLPLAQHISYLNKIPDGTKAFHYLLFLKLFIKDILINCNKKRKKDAEQYSVLFISWRNVFIFDFLSLIGKSSLYSFSLLCKCKWGRYKERRSEADKWSIQSRVIIRIICGLVLWTCTALWPCSAWHLRISSFFSITLTVVKRSFAAGLPAARTLSSIRAGIQPFFSISFTSESQKE